MKEGIEIKPLDKSTLKGALNVLDKVFGDDDEDKWRYTRGFNASLGDKKYLAMYTDERPEHLKYFVAIDKKIGKVVGTTGLYAYKEEMKDNAFSTGWFAVDPEYRGKGIGKQLLEFTINKAKKLKRKFLRLWTTDSPETEVARKMYERRGFIVTKREERANGPDISIWKLNFKIDLAMTLN